MIISFWSTHHGQSATTTNALSVALCASLQYKLRVLMATAQSTDNQLREYLLPEYKAGLGNEKRSSNDLMRLARNGLLQAESIANYTSPILKASLFDVLSGMSLEEKSSDEVAVFKAVLGMAKTTYDAIFIDVHSGLSKHYIESILAFSDVVVINVSQNIAVLEAARDVWQKRSAEQNTFICIGNYESRAKISERQVAKLFAGNPVISIPRHAPLIDAINTGNMLEFFGRYYYRERSDEKQIFFKAVSRSTHKLLKSQQFIE